MIGDQMGSDILARGSLVVHIICCTLSEAKKKDKERRKTVIPTLFLKKTGAWY
jgi:hypothetical protein